jgi:GTP-binding protein Era
VSALTKDGIGELRDDLVSLLPEGPPYFEREQTTDLSTEERVAEVIREKALAVVRDELPHSIAVLVDEMGPSPDRDDLLVIRALLFVERPSQKPIVVGKGGAVLRDIGTRARAELEALLGTHIFLDLHVKVAKEWQRDPKQLQRLGF